MSFAIRSKLYEVARQRLTRASFHHLVQGSVSGCRLSFHTTTFLNVQGQEIKMPSLSPTMSEGTIVKWLKKEGETIAPGDVLCEIQTDKAIMSFETEEEGILAKIVVPENTKDVRVGSLIALMVSEGEDWTSVEVLKTSTASSVTTTETPRTASVGTVSGTNILMPSLSPTMTVGTITKWHKKEGDKISAGDVLCDIQTDKAIMSFETEDEGILAKIIIPEGTANVNVGTLIALTVGGDEDWTQVTVLGSSGSSTNAAQMSSPASGGTVPGLNIVMPSLSPTMTEGTIIKWYKKEGDIVTPGDVLCDIQTDKAVMSFETEEEGILAKIMLAEGSVGVKVGTLIALMVPEGKNWQEVIIPPTEGESLPSKMEKQISVRKKTKSSISRNYGPAVERLLVLYQLDGTQIKPTGRSNKLLKSDVLEFITEKKLLPKPLVSVPLPMKKSVTGKLFATPVISRPKRERYVDIELSSMRKTIAKRLAESKTTIPHSYIAVDCNINVLISLRKQMKSSGVNVSVNDFVIKAISQALNECPLVNCLFLNNETTPAPSIDISVAVATDAGLITPIVKNANLKSVLDISTEVKELASRAKVGKLQLHEFQGGSFTISNLGMFGISEFSAIINPPQCAILAVGGGKSELDVECQPTTKMTSTLSFDARAISEAAVADFLEIFKTLMENPVNILMGYSPGRKRLERMAPSKQCI